MHRLQNGAPEIYHPKYGNENDVRNCFQPRTINPDPTPYEFGVGLFVVKGKARRDPYSTPYMGGLLKIQGPQMPPGNEGMYED